MRRACWPTRVLVKYEKRYEAENYHDPSLTEVILLENGDYLLQELHGGVLLKDG